MMPQIKDGVVLTGIRPEMMIAVIEADRQHPDGTCTITSALDSQHSTTSLHYAGAAIDIRTFDIPEAKREPYCQGLASALGRDFDVLMEQNHIHIEYQPRKPA